MHVSTREKERKREFGVKFAQTQTTNGSLLFNMIESPSMCYTIDKIKTYLIFFSFFLQKTSLPKYHVDSHLL